MKKHVVGRTLALLVLAGSLLLPSSAAAKEPPGADLVDLSYSEKYGVAVLSKYELFWSTDGKDWSPAGFNDRAVRLTAVGSGKNLVMVATETGTLFRSVDSSPFTAVKPPKDPYGRQVTGIRIIAIHPDDEEVLASSGQGVIRSVDKGATWKPIKEPFWANPDAREVIAIGYAKGKPVVVTRRGVYRQTKKGFEPFTKGLPDKVRPTVASVFGGGILMALPGEGIYLATKDSKWKKLKGAPGDPIAFVGHAKKGYLAARPATKLHLGNSKGSGWTKVGQYAPTFIPVDSISSPFGDFIILRGKGLVRLDEGKFVPVRLPVDLASVNAALVAQGNQLAGTQGGVYLSTSAGKAWVDVTPEGLGVTVNVFLLLSDGRILLGSNGAGVFISEDSGRTWRDWSLRLGTSNTIQGLVSFDGGFLAGTENGLMWTQAGKEPNWQRRDGGIGRNSVVSLIQEGNNYWLATQEGVFTAVDKGDFTRIPGIDGRVSSLAAEDGKLLALVNCQVVIRDSGGKLTELPDLSRCIASSVAIKDGVIYTGASDGLYRWESDKWTKMSTKGHPVARLFSGKDRLRVVTRGAGTYYVR